MPWTITDISELDPTATYSVADYRIWPVEQTVHIIKGKLYPIKLGADTVHAVIRGNLFIMLDRQLRRRKEWEYFHAPMDVYLPLPETVVQPDYLICERKLVHDWVFGTPAWMCEIVNEESLELDTITKKAIYEEAAVPEYTLIYPNDQIVEVYKLGGDGCYGEPEVYDNAGQEWEISSVPGVMLRYIELFIES